MMEVLMPTRSRAGAEAPRSLVSPSRPRKRRVGLSAYQETQLKEVLRRSAPSSPWVDAQVKSFDGVDSRGTPVSYRFHDTSVFPPGGAHTAMIRCPACGVFTPPQAFEHGLCLDHAAHDGWGPSPSAVTIRALQLLNLRMEESPLPAEDAAALRKEIQQYKRTGELAN
jgi:hypothetical protein